MSSHSNLEALFSKEFRQQRYVRGFLRRMFSAFISESDIKPFHSDSLIYNETDRLEGEDWVSFALESESDPMLAIKGIYSSDPAFLSENDLIYWLPAMFCQSTINFLTNDEDLPKNLEDLFIPGTWIFKSGLKACLSDNQKHTVIDYLQLRLIRLRKRVGRSPWADFSEHARESILKDCIKIQRGIQYWRQN